MALPPHNPTGPMGANGTTPQGPSYLTQPYKFWPKERRPSLRCGGCDEWMEPTCSASYPHEWTCPKCGGHADLYPPSRTTAQAVRQQPVVGMWPDKQCGVMVHSVRCGNEIRWGDMCCQSCERRILTEMWNDDGNRYTGRIGKRKFILDLVGNLMMQRERAKRLTQERQAKEEKAEAQRKARLDVSHNVVYYARLGQNHIKIGTTSDLPRRMHELRVVNANNLLAAEPGGPDVEKQRHQQFKKWRYNHRREDFAESRELHEHIGGIRAEHGEPYTLAAKLAQKAA